LPHLQTGEEAEKALVDMKCKLYRFDPESSEWKERGIGQVKIKNQHMNQIICEGQG